MTSIRPRDIDPAHLATLRRFDTPTVCNVIELFDVRPRSAGFLDGGIRCLFPELTPIVGFATTATFRSAHPAAEGDVYSGFVEQVERFEKELPRPRIVVFQDIDGTPCGATFGEVMCTVYKSFGCAGLITSGAARDVDQVRKLGFACFAASAIASHAYCRVVDVHVPVTIGGCLIRPGDLIHADANGATTIPLELVAGVARGCELFVDAEKDLLEYLAKERAPTLALLAEKQKGMRARIASIVETVRRETRR